VVYNQLGRSLTSQELQRLLPGCDGFIAGLDQIDRAALAAADRLKVIARYGAGVDNVDLQAAAEKGIVVTNTPAANAISVAELTVGLLLALARNIPALAAETRAGKWPRPLSGIFDWTGLTLQGKTVGLIGLGAIGREVALRLRAFGCTLIAHDPAADTTFAATHGILLAALPEVLARADFLSLHVPLLPTTRGLVDAAFLAQMKAGAFLVNTARGELVDETALLEALQTGHLRGAALDVFTVEPPVNSPLLALPQVIAVPHCGAHTDGAMNAMGWGALRACLAVLRGEAPEHRVV
jgi:D-3-phosphoglycerate dehydrogenase